MTALGGECVTVKILNQAESFMCTKNRMHELSRNFVLRLQLSGLPGFFEVLKGKVYPPEQFLTFINMINFTFTLLPRPDSPRGQDQQRR